MHLPPQKNPNHNPLESPQTSLPFLIVSTMKQKKPVAPASLQAWGFSGNYLYLSFNKFSISLVSVREDNASMTCPFSCYCSLYIIFLMNANLLQ